MKISLNIAQEYSNVPLRDISTQELVEKIGVQLGAVEEVIETGKKYEGIVVAKVVTCIKHPGADKLHICTIDDGGITPNVKRDESDHIQVVCGAPNVREGMLVAWLPPGVTVPSTLGKDPLVLEVREIRGEISNGMLASASELGLSDDHDGILEILADDVGEEGALPGTPFNNLYGLDDTIIDVENKMFTHRPDCFGVIGVARELAGIQGKAFVSPDWYATTPTFQAYDETSLQITNEAGDLVPRFMAVAMSDITVQKSPMWLQVSLLNLGMKSINNIVDITNYLMYVTGQPLHAYDADKLPSSGQLSTRMSLPGEKINLLNGKQLELTDDSTIVISSEEVAVGIGGVMGGSDTEVDTNTKNIIIECATFNMYNIRRTSMKYGLFTDAVTRFNKGQSPLQNDRVLAKAMEMVTQLAHGNQASTVTDVSENMPALKTVVVSTKFINERLGLDLSTAQIMLLLKNVEFISVPEPFGSTKFTTPFWRTDIEIPEDIVEEVGRLYGYDKLPLVLPMRSSKPVAKDEYLEIKKQIREVLSRAGANEVLTYSFVHGRLLEAVGQKSEHSYKLSNAISPDLQYYRQTLTPSLLDKVHLNIKAGYDEFALYEMAKTHSKVHGNDETGIPGELQMLGLVYANSKADNAYYEVRKYLDYLLGSFGIELQYTAIEDSPDYPVTSSFDLARSAYVITKDGDFLGIVGEYREDVAAKLKLPAATAGFEIGTEAVAGAVAKQVNSPYNAISRYPNISQDICLRSENITYSVLLQKLDDVLKECIAKDISYSVSLIDIYQKDGDNFKQTTFRIEFVSHERTLQASYISDILKKLANTLLTDNITQV